MTSIDDLDLQATIINRVLKRTLPEKAQLSKDAKIAFKKAATVFISYLSATAQEFCTKGNVKTVSAKHIFSALTDIGFEEIVPDMKQLFNCMFLSWKTNFTVLAYQIKNKQKKTRRDLVKEVDAMNDELEGEDMDEHEEDTMLDDAVQEDEEDTMLDDTMQEEEKDNIQEEKEEIKDEEEGDSSLKRKEHFDEMGIDKAIKTSHPTPV